MTLRLGTRGSALAVTQSGLVARALQQATGREVALVTIATRGDLVTDRPLGEVGGKGLFTKEIEQALLDGEVDLAVHSMKDMPGDAPGGLCVPCIPQREDPRDVLVGAPLAALPQGAVLGTGSLRRGLQIRALRPDLQVKGIRGNVDTRIAKQRGGEYHAVVLAAAGLARLGRLGEASEHLPVEDCIPAPGQGALAVQCREDDHEVQGLLDALHHAETAVCVAAERAFLIALSGGCSVPAACHARLIDGSLEVRAFFAPEGGEARRWVGRGRPEDAEEIGREAAARVL